MRLTLQQISLGLGTIALGLFMVLAILYGRDHKQLENKIGTYFDFNAYKEWAIHYNGQANSYQLQIYFENTKLAVWETDDNDTLVSNSFLHAALTDGFYTNCILTGKLHKPCNANLTDPYSKYTMATTPPHQVFAIDVVKEYIEPTEDCDQLHVFYYDEVNALFRAQDNQFTEYYFREDACYHLTGGVAGSKLVTGPVLRMPSDGTGTNMRMCAGLYCTIPERLLDIHLDQQNGLLTQPVYHKCHSMTDVHPYRCVVEQCHFNSSCAQPVNPGFYYDTFQAACKPCPLGTYNSECRNYDFIECVPWSTCNDTQFEAKQGTPFNDSTCMPLTTCNKTEYISTDATKTSDRKCSKCPLGFHTDHINAYACTENTRCEPMMVSGGSTDQASDIECFPVDIQLLCFGMKWPEADVPFMVDNIQVYNNFSVYKLGMGSCDVPLIDTTILNPATNESATSTIGPIWHGDHIEYALFKPNRPDYTFNHRHRMIVIAPSQPDHNDVFMTLYVHVMHLASYAPQFYFLSMSLSVPQFIPGNKEFTTVLGSFKVINSTHARAFMDNNTFIDTHYCYKSSFQGVSQSPDIYTTELVKLYDTVGHNCLYEFNTLPTEKLFKDVQDSRTCVQFLFKDSGMTSYSEYHTLQTMTENSNMCRRKIGKTIYSGTTEYYNAIFNEHNENAVNVKKWELNMLKTAYQLTISADTSDYGRALQYDYDQEDSRLIIASTTPYTHDMELELESDVNKQEKNYDKQTILEYTTFWVNDFFEWTDIGKHYVIGIQNTLPPVRSNIARFYSLNVRNARHKTRFVQEMCIRRQYYDGIHDMIFMPDNPPKNNIFGVSFNWNMSAHGCVTFYHYAVTFAVAVYLPNPNAIACDLYLSKSSTLASSACGWCDCSASPSSQSGAYPFLYLNPDGVDNHRVFSRAEYGPCACSDTSQQQHDNDCVWYNKGVQQNISC